MKIKANQTDEPVVLACPYYLNYDDENGVSYKIQITGDEIFSTICPDCGQEHNIEYNIFFDIALEYGIYGTTIKCDECSSKHKYKEKK